MTDTELDALVEDLRAAAAAWFDNKLLLRLEALITETKRARANELIDCPQCGGSGFSGYGSGYGDVCGHCGGQKRLPR